MVTFRVHAALPFTARKDMPDEQRFLAVVREEAQPPSSDGHHDDTHRDVVASCRHGVLLTAWRLSFGCHFMYRNRVLLLLGVVVLFIAARHSKKGVTYALLAYQALVLYKLPWSPASMEAHNNSFHGSQYGVP